MSSWEEYTDKETKGICEKNVILEQFKNVEGYKEFALSSLDSIIIRKESLKDFDKFVLE